jgi:RimJ/RimL family protein N-acetyltransferase
MNSSIPKIEVTDLRDSDFRDYYLMLRDANLARRTGFEPVLNKHKAQMLFQSENDTNLTFAIRLKATQQLIGIINVFPEIGTDFAPNYKNVELGYFLASAYQRHGYMPVALHKVLSSLTEAKIVEATVEKSNYPSQKVLQKLGFQQIDAYDNNLVFSLSLK